MHTMQNAVMHAGEGTMLLLLMFQPCRPASAAQAREDPLFRRRARSRHWHQQASV